MLSPGDDLLGRVFVAKLELRQIVLDMLNEALELQTRTKFTPLVIEASCLIHNGLLLLFLPQGDIQRRSLLSTMLDFTRTN